MITLLLCRYRNNTCTTCNYLRVKQIIFPTPRCEKHTECGFMLKVTPCSKEEVSSFNIELVTEESEYPADIHCHSEVISAAHMHLVMEYYSTGRWCNTCICWGGKPEYSEERGGVVWGGVLCNHCRARLVVYYDIRDKK